jgi:uncharacterized protein (TIGR03067 family)
VPTLFAAVLVPMVTLAAAADDKKAEADLKAMVGKWKMETAKFDGKEVTNTFKGLKFEIREGGKYAVDFGDEKDEGTFTVDPSKAPKEIDIKSTGGPNKGKTIKAIYKLDSDTLTVCYEFDATAAQRPTEFESKDKTTHLLITYKREKK